MTKRLVEPLFDGPLDIVGDIHGEIDALRALVGQLGYTTDGVHPNGRRLVFVGDLTDRGPDSPVVVDLVQRLIDRRRAQCVLGNHELNILLDHPKAENRWFYGEEFTDRHGNVIPQRLADQPMRERLCAFFRTLPIALKRHDLRVVHACWCNAMVDIVRESGDVVALYQRYFEMIEAELAGCDDLDGIDRGLQHQNRNPVKLLTSGPEERSDQPIDSGGKIRHERRVPWWEDYDEDTFCVFGHYSHPLHISHASAFCVDYAVGKRWTERRQPDFDGRFVKTRLAAVRFPEKIVVFDDGEQIPVA